MKKHLKFVKNNNPSNHPDSTYWYDNIGSVYNALNEYSQALTFYEKALQIRQEILSKNHIDFAYSYNNIARVYSKMG